MLGEKQEKGEENEKDKIYTLDEIYC